MEGNANVKKNIDFWEEQQKKPEVNFNFDFSDFGNTGSGAAGSGTITTAPTQSAQFNFDAYENKIGIEVKD